jgi:hypothetical protein
MTGARARLWTIAHRDFVDRVRARGRAHAAWEQVEPRWIPAYRWMAERLRERGLVHPGDTADVPPVWAWHSCGGWQAPPDATTVDMLFGTEPANREGLCLVTWSAPVERLLLSRYGPWCALLDQVVAGGRPEDAAGGVLLPPSRLAGPPPGWRPGDHVQACVHALEWRDVEAVSPLPGTESG